MKHQAEAVPMHGGAGWPHPASQASFVPFANAGTDSLTAKLCGVVQNKLFMGGT